MRYHEILPGAARWERNITAQYAEEISGNARARVAGVGLCRHSYDIVGTVVGFYRLSVEKKKNTSQAEAQGL